jgi:hypothetical protein
MTVPHSYRSKVLAAVEAEPELPGDMPDEMWEELQTMDREEMVTALRIVVRQTKDGIRDRIAALSDGPAEQGWIPCSERVPPFDQLVIAWSPPYGAVLADRTTSNPDRGWSCCGDGVTHWMPLPDHPSATHSEGDNDGAM